MLLEGVKTAVQIINFYGTVQLHDGKHKLPRKLYLVPYSKKSFMSSCKSSYAPEMRSWSTPKFLLMHDLWIPRYYSNYVLVQALNGYSQEGHGERGLDRC